MLRKFNEMFGTDSDIEKRIEEILLSIDDKKLAKELILEEIKNAYKSAFDYAWTKGNINFVANTERRKQESLELKGEMDLRLKEYLNTGENVKSGYLLYKSK